MAKYSTLTALFTAIANSLRSKTGNSAKIVADDFPSVIDSLSTGGITPTGTKSITTNGEHDVTSYANAEVNVPTPELKCVVRKVSVSADVTGAKEYTLLSGDEFIKTNYANDWFSVVMFADTPTAATGVVSFGYQGNRKIAASNYGVGYRYTSASAVGQQPLTAKISADGWSQSMRAKSNGNLTQYLSANYILAAGTYTIILISAENAT